MPSMDNADRDELAALRLRAYGPDADIDGHPEALARLRRLEAFARVEETGEGEAVADSSETAGGEEPRRQADTRLPVPESPANGSAASAPPVWTPPRIGRALLIGWAASIVIVAVAVGALVFGLAAMRPVSTDTGARQVAALQTRVAGVQAGDGTDVFNHATGVYRYAGLVVAVLDKGVLDPDELCLLVAPEQSLVGEGEIWFASGCTAGRFRATASVVVGTKSPAELRDGFADGTALQFVWDGTAVGVFAADPPAPENTPARPSGFPMDLGRLDVGP